MANRALFAIVASLTVAGAAMAQPAGNAAKGRKDFYALGCSACHGTVGQGAGMAGPRVAPDPVPFVAFIAQLRDPAARMPRYTKAVLDDAEAADLYAFLRSVPRGKPAAQIDILKK